MIWHLVAAVFAGLAAAGIGLLLRTISRKRLPKWIVPVFGGLGMLGYQVQFEYDWFEHKQLQLPETAQVISSDTSSNMWRPWTLIFPITTTFSVVDSENVRAQTVDGDLVAEFILYQFERRHTDLITTQPYILNCSSRELIPLNSETGGADLNELRTLRDTSPLLTTVCQLANERQT